MTVREAITEYAQVLGEPVSLRQLTDGLPYQAETVRRTTARMIDSGDLLPTPDGKYTLDTSRADSPTPTATDSEPDSQDSESVPPDTTPDTPAFSGIGKYDHATGGMLPWRPKSG